MIFLIYAHTYLTDLIQFKLTPTFQMGCLGRDVHVLVRVVQSLIFCALFCRCCLFFFFLFLLTIAFLMFLKRQFCSCNVIK